MQRRSRGLSVDTGWLRRARNSSREILAAMRPHDHTAMFTPTDPVGRAPGEARPMVVLVETDTAIR